VVEIFLPYFFFSLFPKQSQQQQQQLKCSATIIMATKISNVMPKIQAVKFFIFFPITPSLKNVTLSSSNEKKE
jgi:hypothetical protein